MNKNNSSRLLLTELLFVLLFFMVIIAVCVQILVSAYNMSADTTKLNKAVNMASNAAEEFLANEDVVETYEKDGLIRHTEIASTSTGFLEADIKVVDADEEVVYELSVKKPSPYSNLAKKTDASIDEMEVQP